MAFYLSADECAEVNRLHAEYWDRRRVAGAMLWASNTINLQPDPEMDDSVFLD